MSSQNNNTVTWRIHLQSTPAKVFEMLATQAGRESFWAESAPEEHGHILFRFPGGEEWRGQILATEPPRLFRVMYYGGSITTFRLEPDGKNGTDLVLRDENVPEPWLKDVHAGWISVLMALKAAADYGIDLRNHDPQRTWNQGYADN